MSHTFAVAVQSVTSPAGFRVEFATDPADYSRCICRVYAVGPPDQPSDRPNDHLEMVFARGGAMIGTRMVDAEVEAEAVERAAAERRLAALPAAAVSEDERKAKEDERAKQIEADRALLAAEPKVSKYEPKEAPPAEPETAPVPSAQGPGPKLQGFGPQGQGASR